MEDALVPQHAGGLSQIERVVDTFVAPSKTFTDILRSTSWWLPFLLLILSSLTTAVVVQRQVGFERSYENQVRQSPKQQERMDAMTPEQRAASIKVGGKITAGFTYGSWLLVLIFFLIYSLLVWAAVNFGLGAATTYWQVFAVVMYASLPYLILTVLTVVTLLFGGNAESYDYKNPVGTNLAYFMPDASPVVKAVLGALDVAKLWSLVLEVIGIAIIARKTIAQSAIVVVGLWALGVLLQVGAAAVS